jgi:hypothetical protein
MKLRQIIVGLETNGAERIWFVLLARNLIPIHAVNGPSQLPHTA